MSDYISREAIGLTDFEIVMCNGDYKELCKILLDKIANIPAADVRPVVRGKWIDHQEGRWIYAKCSECGTVHDVKSNFCPNCGAYTRPEEATE